MRGGEGSSVHGSEGSSVCTWQRGLRTLLSGSQSANLQSVCEALERQQQAPSSNSTASSLAVCCENTMLSPVLVGRPLLWLLSTLHHHQLLLRCCCTPRCDLDHDVFVTL